jgi:cytochrome P450
MGLGLSRITTDTTMISNYELPPGVSTNLSRWISLTNYETMVAAFTAAMARDGHIWPDPQSFVPERWLSQYKGVEADRKAFMPFSAGSRNCIGQQYVLNVSMRPIC